MSERTSDEELLFSTSFSVSTTRELVERLILSDSPDPLNVRAAFALLDFFLLLCYKWKRSNSITNKDEVKQITSEVKILYEKLHSRFFSVETSQNDMQIRYPRTTDLNLEKLLIDMNYPSLVLEGLVETDQEVAYLEPLQKPEPLTRKMVEQANKERPITIIRFPSTENRTLYSILDNMSYNQTLYLKETKP